MKWKKLTAKSKPKAPCVLASRENHACCWQQETLDEVLADYRTRYSYYCDLPALPEVR